MYYLLLYDVVDGYVKKRAQFRDIHLKLAKESLDRGELFADPVDGASLVFRGEDRSVAERFAESDPYVRNGVGKKWRVRDWNVVVGGDARP